VLLTGRGWRTAGPDASWW